MYSFGDIVLTTLQFPDTYEVKSRPAVVLFQEEGNIVLAGVTGKAKERGAVYLYKKEGAAKDCVIKLNYLFTVAPSMIQKTLFTLSDAKKTQLKSELDKRFK